MDHKNNPKNLHKDALIKQYKYTLTNWFSKQSSKQMKEFYQDYVNSEVFERSFSRKTLPVA